MTMDDQAPSALIHGAESPYHEGLLNKILCHLCLQMREISPILSNTYYLKPEDWSKVWHTMPFVN